MTRPTIDEHFRIHSPSLHDYEVEAITFENPDVVMKLVTFDRDQRVVLRFKRCEFLFFSSSHMQNVLWNGYLFPPDRRNEARGRDEFERAMELIRKKVEYHSIDLDRATITYLSPSTGAETICVSRSVFLYPSSAKAGR